jgi:AcrR family transcriptional regulator
MPKIVDHERRRRELAEAVWRVIRREGIEAASIRAVAEESGWSAGALRHYFTSSAELLAFAMGLVTDRVSARVGALAADQAGAAEPRPVAERLLREILPLDDERRAEAEVWLAFSARALVDPGLRALRDNGDAALHELCADVVGALAGGGDVELEADRLHALVDGLALHALLEPARMPPARMLRALARHLDSLAP